MAQPHPWLGAWLNRPYRLPHRRFRVRTEDNVPIVGVHIEQAGTETVLIYAHGFLSNKNHRAVPRFVEALSTAFDVMSFDFRGHGESGGKCTFGALEMLDMAAVVNHAHTCGYRRVVLVGSSMGGAVAIHYAAEHNTVDGRGHHWGLRWAGHVALPHSTGGVALALPSPSGPLDGRPHAGYPTGAPSA
ncbi:MAG: alpha/beta fold hydrolase [Ardenticatenia bacterium]|nr:alpha/beta fold hydrolase [Ardenticatenia bacterium]